MVILLPSLWCNGHGDTHSIWKLRKKFHFLALILGQFYQYYRDNFTLLILTFIILIPLISTILTLFFRHFYLSYQDILPFLKQQFHHFFVLILFSKETFSVIFNDGFFKRHLAILLAKTYDVRANTSELIPT